MAYGKIKADSIIYDNSGSDVEKTIAALSDPTPEGTAVKSTTNGNETNTSYLRADGDGTCSWQTIPVPTTITVADESSDTTCNVLFTTAATGNLAPKSGTNLTFNSNTGILTATGFAGDITGDVTGDVTGNVTGNASGSSGSCTGNSATATEATNVTAVANNSTDETVYPTFIDGATGTQGIETDTGLTYNPSTGLLSTAAVTTTGNIIVGGNLTVSGTTTTVSSTTLEVADKNLELGKVSSPSDTTANGGGITLKGASDKTITWDNTSNYWTFNQGIETTAGAAKITGIEGGDANLYLYADEGDDNGDKWLIQSESDGYFALKNYTSGAWETNIKAIGDGAVELYHNDIKTVMTSANGLKVIGPAAGNAEIQINSDEGDDNADYWRIQNLAADNTLVFQNYTTGAYTTTLKLNPNGALEDSKGDVRSIPQNTQAGAYTLVASDAGKHILAGGNITWADNTFSAGQAVTIINNSGSDITITRGNTAVQYNTADAVNGNKTLAGRGMATIIFASGTLAYISGSGLS